MRPSTQRTYPAPHHNKAPSHPIIPIFFFIFKIILQIVADLTAFAAYPPNYGKGVAVSVWAT